MTERHQKAVDRISRGCIITDLVDDEQYYIHTQNGVVAVLRLCDKELFSIRLNSFLEFIDVDIEDTTIIFKRFTTPPEKYALDFVCFAIFLK